MAAKRQNQNPKQTLKSSIRPLKLTMTSAELAEMLGISEGTLRNMRAKGNCPDYLRLSGKRSPVLYRISDVETWLASKVQEQNERRGKNRARGTR